MVHSSHASLQKLGDHKVIVRNAASRLLRQVVQQHLEWATSSCLAAEPIVSQGRSKSHSPDGGVERTTTIVFNSVLARMPFSHGAFREQLLSLLQFCMQCFRAVETSSSKVRITTDVVVSLVPVLNDNDAQVRLVLHTSSFCAHSP